MKEYWSKRIAGITPYTPGEQPKIPNLIKLNTNENPYGPSPKVVEAIKDNIGDALKLYPDPECSTLVRSIATRMGLNENQVFVGNGSDEVLAMAFQAFFDVGSEIVFPDITYSFYPVYANMFSVNYRTVPLREDFTVPVEELCGNNAGVIIANPNAPTGIELPMESIEKICTENPNVVVIVDEAYVDFGGHSAVGLIEKYDNLLVVQTFSKSRSLAGMRIGFAMGNANLISGLNCVKNSINSYTLDRLAIVAGNAAIEDEEYFETCCRNVIETREYTVNQLRELGFSIPDSKANFIFASHSTVPAKTLMAQLRERGILVRYFALPRIDNYLRITIGKREDMETLCREMAQLVK